jgi:predicted GIY-YIG superfamily endonuclease
MVKSRSYFKGKKVVYSLNLKGGNKYVGKTDDIERRLRQHFGGAGSRWTRRHEPVSVNHIQVCQTAASQARAETVVYENMRDYHGVDRVRGAGHTRSD